MDLDHVTYSTDDGIAVLTLNRPERLNAISAGPGGTREQLIQLLERAEADPAIGCVVLAGAGRAFCGGGDLTGNARRESLAEHRAFLEGADRFHQRIAHSTLPTIAAVHGHCLGAGLLLASSCDLVIAAEGATFGFPEGRLGLVGAASMTAQLGRQWATFLMLTGESIDAHQARQLGLVLTVEADSELLQRACELAQRVARMPRQATLSNRRSIQAAAEASGDAAARHAALDGDTATLLGADRATAPDGRTFREIIDSEGIEGLKRARVAQWDSPWLR